MLTLVAQVLAVRYGTIEENNQKWAKIQTVDDVLENSKGFIGQRTVEYSVPSEYVDNIVAVATLPNAVPAYMSLEMTVQMSGGKPVMKCIGAKTKADKA